MIGKEAYVMRSLDYGVVVVEGADMGGIGCCCSNTGSEGGHVCIGSKSRDTAVTYTRRQQQQQQQREVKNSSSSSSREKSASAAATAAAGGRGWSRRGWIVRWIPFVGSGNTRGDGVSFVLVTIGLRSTVAFLKLCCLLRRG